MSNIYFISLLLRGVYEAIGILIESISYTTEIVTEKAFGRNKKVFIGISLHWVKDIGC